MYNHGISVLAVLLAIVMSGCHRNEFKVDFSLDEKISGNYEALYYASNPEKGLIREQVAVVNAGKGELKGVTYNPTLVYFFKGGRQPEAIAYAERGDRLKITGKDASPAGWSISGNPVTERLSAWRVENRSALSAEDKVKINSAVGAYVRKNPSDPVSALLLLLYYDRGEDESGFRNLWKLLKGEAAEEKWNTLVSRADMITGTVVTTGNTDVMIFRGVNGRRDTVNPKKGKALLCFIEDTGNGRKETIARIKKMVKARKDSAKSVIVVVGFESDSTTWRYKLRSDSLKGVVNVWMPLGYNDSLAMRLGVRRLPALLEIDSTGKVKKLKELPE